MSTSLRPLSRAVAGVLASVVAAPIAFAQGAPDSGFNLPGKTKTVRQVVIQIVNYLLTFVGLIAVAMLIYGGFKYLTSAGNEETTKKAKAVILYALIGIVIIALSFVIVNTIIGQGSAAIDGQPITN